MQIHPDDPIVSTAIMQWEAHTGTTEERMLIVVRSIYSAFMQRLQTAEEGVQRLQADKADLVTQLESMKDQRRRVHAMYVENVRDLNSNIHQRDEYIRNLAGKIPTKTPVDVTRRSAPEVAVAVLEGAEDPRATIKSLQDALSDVLAREAKTPVDGRRPMDAYQDWAQSRATVEVEPGGRRE